MNHDTEHSAPPPVPVGATTPTADLLASTRRIGGDIETVLGRLLQRVRRRFLLHGLGWIVAAIALGTLLYFVLDRTLDLPVAVRVLLSVAFAVYLAFGVRRRIVYPVRRAIAGDDIAIALERRFPELRQRLISAVQLARSAAHRDSARDRPGAERATVGAALEAPHGESSAMIAKVVEQAADDIRRLPTAALLDPRRTLRVWACGGLAVLLAGVSLAWVPGTASVFFQRMFGADVSYPRRTHLYVELPLEDPEFRVTLAPGTARVVMPAGGDLPVLVRVEGVVPRDVMLRTRGGKGLAPEVSMTPRGEDRFRHVFRRVHAPFTFHASGGDDPDGDLSVSVEVIEPPRVASIRASITYPEYTGLPPAEVVGGGIEAVVGSTVRLHVTATAAVASAKLQLLDSGQTSDLTPESIQDDSGVGVAYTGTIDIVRSDRYQIQLVGPDSIGNPHPGTYPILALEDHAPVARLVSPVDDELNVVLPNGLLPVRIRAGDDFGIQSIVVVTVAGRGDHEIRTELHAHASATPSASDALETAPVDLEVARLFEVADLGAAGIAVGDTIVVSGEVVDNRAPDLAAPTPQTTEVQRRQVHVVGPTDLGRRVANHFRRIRESVEKALTMQVDRRERLEQMLENLAADAEIASLGAELITVEVGQGRVLAEVRRVHRELMRSFDVHLFNRVEESIHAPKVLELYAQFRPTDAAASAAGAAQSESSLPPEFYRNVQAARASGAIGAMEKTLDPILAMLSTADRLAEQHAPTALRQVESASVTSMRSEYGEALRSASATQATIVAELEELRARLDEWNEFQDVITQTRAIRDKQRDLRNRTNSLQEGTK